MPATNTAKTESIHLQAIGLCHAKRGGEFAVGDVTVWNFGFRSRVEAVRVVSKCFVELDLLSERDGKVYPRRIKSDRLVGFSSSPW